MLNIVLTCSLGVTDNQIKLLQAIMALGGNDYDRVKHQSTLNQLLAHRKELTET